MAEDRRQNGSRRAFLEALGKAEPKYEEENKPNTVQNREGGEDPEGSDEPLPWDAAAEEEGNSKEPAVPGEEPDLVGKGAVGAKRILGFLLRPLWKCLSVFLAPVWKPFQKGALGITRRDWILFLGMIASVCVAITTPVLIVKMKNTHRENDGIYGWFANQKYTWESGKFEIDDKNQVQFRGEDGQVLDVSGQPFYYSGQDTMFWPFDGVWYSVTEQKCGKVERFSTIQYEYGKGCLVTSPGGKQAALGGYVYDDKDTYAFFEAVTLHYNGEEKKLAPLSYVRTNYNRSIEIVSYGEDTAEVVILQADPTVYFENGARINLNADMMYYPNGVYRLVFGVLDFFDTVGE